MRTEYKYQADGWLGILMGTKLYFDCISLEQVKDAALRVAKELGERGKAGGDFSLPPIETKRTLVYSIKFRVYYS